MPRIDAPCCCVVAGARATLYRMAESPRYAGLASGGKVIRVARRAAIVMGRVSRAFGRSRPSIRRGPVSAAAAGGPPTPFRGIASITATRKGEGLPMRLAAISEADGARTGTPRVASRQGPARPACAIASSSSRTAGAAAFIGGRERPPPPTARLLICQAVRPSRPSAKRAP